MKAEADYASNHEPQPEGLTLYLMSNLEPQNIYKQGRYHQSHALEKLIS